MTDRLIARCLTTFSTFIHLYHDNHGHQSAERYQPCVGLNQPHPVLKSSMLPT